MKEDKQPGVCHRRSQDAPLQLHPPLHIRGAPGQCQQLIPLHACFASTKHLKSAVLRLRYMQPCALRHCKGLPLGPRAGAGSPTHAVPEQECTSASVSRIICDGLSSSRAENAKMHARVPKKQSRVEATTPARRQAKWQAAVMKAHCLG